MRSNMMRHGLVRMIALLGLLCLSACAVRREVDISANPPDAALSVDGMPRGVGPLHESITFKSGDDQHKVTASRSGYRDQTITLSRDDPNTAFQIDLKPFTRRVAFNVLPVPGIISINGVAQGTDPVRTFAKELDFTKDSHDAWTKYTITASRPGFQPAQVVITYTDPSAEYLLTLEPMRKALTLTTTPPGAAVSIDGQGLGVSPILQEAREFRYDIVSEQYIPQKVTVSKPGYPNIDSEISWDGGKSDYHIDLIPRKKTVRIITDPMGAAVSINGKPLALGSDGVASGELVYTPTNDKGDLPTFNAIVTKKTAETEWYPSTMPIGWDEGKTTYTVTLKEIKTRQVPQTSVVLARNSDGVWEMNLNQTDTVSMKDVSEGPGKVPPARLYAAPVDATIGSLTVSPTGNLVLFTLVTGKTRADLRSQVMAIASSGTGGVQQITDGKALDLMPAFTPDGDQIVFASNRAGKRLNIWRKSFSGGPGIEQLTNSDEQDLWPMIDASAKPRLFYQAFSDSQADGQLYMAPAEGGPRVNLTTISVSQPRISPRADAVVFTSVNQRTGNREIYRIPDKGGPPVNLTNDPDSDCYDPVWSRDGSMIAYVSDRGTDEDGRHNADIWIIDLAHPDKPIQVTANGSIDDCPAWDPSSNAIYFRSNRGGQWGIWKISVK